MTLNVARGAPSARDRDGLLARHLRLIRAARRQRLGQPTLEHKIGASGMGVVIAPAMRCCVGRRRSSCCRRSGAIATGALRAEVQMTAQCEPSNTVAIYDYGRTPDGVFGYAMEFLDGINLEDPSARADR